MTDIAVQETIVDRFTGELVPATPEKAALFLKTLRTEYRVALNEMVRECEEILLVESERQGKKTLRYGQLEARVTGGSELVWDVQILRQLLKKGLPDDRFQELVRTTVEEKVDARVAKQLESASAKYAKVIRKARGTVQKPLRITVVS